MKRTVKTTCGRSVTAVNVYCCPRPCPVRLPPPSSVFWWSKTTTTSRTCSATASGRAGFAVDLLHSGAEVHADGAAVAAGSGPARPDAARPRRARGLPDPAQRPAHGRRADHHAHRPRRRVRPHRRPRAGRRRLHHQAVQPQRGRRARARAAAPRASHQPAGPASIRSARPSTSNDTPCRSTAARCG